MSQRASDWAPTWARPVVSDYTVRVPAAATTPPKVLGGRWQTAQKPRRKKGTVTTL